MTREQLAAYAAKEIRALKMHATEDERAKLDFERLDTSSLYSCIYGQMTGDCYSSRALKLIKLCANQRHSFCRLNIDDIRESKPRVYANYTDLEVFIKEFPEHNKEIIAYLRGEIKTLRIK